MSTDRTDPGADGVAAVVRDHQTATFFSLAFALSWGLWIPVWLDLLPALGTITLGIFGPPVAAVLTTAAAGGSVRGLLAGLARWRVPPRWYALALGVPLALLVVEVPGMAALGYDLQPSVLTDRVVFYPVSLGVLVLIGGGQEELGWRGFALPRLQDRLGALPGTLLLGGLWAAWHWPLFAIPAPGYGSLHPAVHGLTIVGMAVALTWVFNETGGSVLLAMLLHGSVNAAGGLLPVPTAVLQGSPLALQVLQMVGVWLVAGAAIVVAGRSLGAADGEDDPHRDPDRPSGAVEGDGDPAADP